MTDIEEQKRLFKSGRNFSYEDIYSCINVIPALFWRIEIVKNRIDYINEFELPGLGNKSTLLLKNMNFRREVILEEDLYVFENFMKSVNERKSALSIFRIRLENSTVRWLKIAGGPDPYRSNYYAGYILEITDVVDFLRVRDNRGVGIEKEINLFDNPVLLVNFSDRKIHAVNQFFVEFFGRSQEDLQELYLDDIFDGNVNTYMQGIFEEIIFHRRWNGELIFKDSKEKEYTGEVAIRALSDRGRNLLWISICKAGIKNGKSAESVVPVFGKPSAYNSLLGEKVMGSASEGDMVMMLNTILDNQPIERLADSILYSDVHVKEDKVYTYGVGPAFKSLNPGEEYPYEGTIAENIIKYDLKDIIVEDTFQSIKPIDWALFIPKGVKSYYAKPMFENGALRTVLIFCSKKSLVFSEKNSRSYNCIFPVFQKGLDVWRVSKKR